MRLFTAVDIPADVRGRLTELLEEFRPVARLRWSRPENLHVTTKFIGEWPENRLAELETVLKRVQGAPFPVQIEGFGWFPNPHHPRALFAGVRAPEALPELARATGDACAAVGIELEKKRYHPHVTLARVSAEDGLAELRRAIAVRERAEFGGFQARSFALFASKMGPGGSNYTKLKEFALE
ncbi:MAG: RNA 2',3'-cyclic phosphodiesterase [Acidobacteria bacterium]|nr:RNA 2',3'-cyclic phosphodiesterase [Acidobacteriota bacterium]